MSLVNALRDLGEHKSAAGQLEIAITVCEETLKNSACKDIPLFWANTVGNQGWARLSLANLTADAALARTGLSQLREAAHQLRVVGHPPRAKTFEGLMPSAEELVKRLSRPA